MKNIARLTFIITIFLLIATLSLAIESDAPSIKASINKKRIFIGDRIRYKVEITSRYNLEIEFPLPKDNKIGDCEIKDSRQEVKKSLFKGPRRTYINWFDITSYYVGKRKIPPIEIKYREIGEGNWKVLKTDELPFTVESVIPRSSRLYDIKDIKGPIYPFSFLKLLVWIVIALVIIWALFKLVKRFKKKIPPKPPFEIALDELKAAQQALSLNGDTKEYYVRISDAVRRYIEISFALRAPEMTTQEFLASLSNSPKLSGTYKDLLKVFMEACDLVKFAKHAPSRTEIDSVFVSAKKFIEETKEAYVSI